MPRPALSRSTNRGADSFDGNLAATREWHGVTQVLHSGLSFLRACTTGAVRGSVSTPLLLVAGAGVPPGAT